MAWSASSARSYAEAAALEEALAPFEERTGIEANYEGTGDFNNLIRILTTRFGDSPTPMFEDEPGCFLHRQASSITTFFPEDVQAALTTDEPEAGVFGLPPIGDDAAPVMGGGDVAGMSNEADAVVQTMAFLGATEFAEGWAPAGGYISRTPASTSTPTPPTWSVRSAPSSRRL